MSRSSNAAVLIEEPAHDPVWASVGLALRRARVCYAVGLRELSREIEVSATYLSKVENGQTAASERILREYSDRFRVDFDELNRLAGRIPSDVKRHLVRTPGALQQLRDQMASTAAGSDD